MRRLSDIINYWRYAAITAMALIAVVLLLGEVNDETGLGVFFLAKATGFALVWVIYRLTTYWNANGKINELTALAEEE